MTKKSILFICLGNICRSPLAEGVFRAEAIKAGKENQLTIDSAGIGGWHVGNASDSRAINIAGKYGIDIARQSCRQLTAQDFHDFDLIIGMDHENIADANNANTQNGNAEIAMFALYAGMGEIEIPDPYYGREDGFEIAYQLVKKASMGVLARL